MFHDIVSRGSGLASEARRRGEPRPKQTHQRLRSGLHGLVLGGLLLGALGLPACKRSAQTSVEKASLHVAVLAKAVATDVAEVRSGLPKGAEQLALALTPKPGAAVPPGTAVPPVASATATAPGASPASSAPVAAPLAAGAPAASAAPVASSLPATPVAAPTALEQLDFQTAREALNKARRNVQDLRVAKCTFFALVNLDGVVVRTDGDQDLMAGKSLFGAFPELKAQVTQRYVETRGSMPEAAGVRGRSDGQWVAAAPIVVQGTPRAVYAAGWSWASYAYRLETAIRGVVTSELAEREKQPLVYVYVLVGNEAHGAPVSPDVNAAAIVGAKALEKTPEEGVFGSELSIAGRDFGLAVKRAPELGKDVAIAVLRSEV